MARIHRPRNYTTEEEVNLALVEGLFENVLNAIDDEAVDFYIWPDYIQHSPSARQGTGPLKELLRRIKRDHPQSVHDVKRMMVDGDMVMVHYHARRWPGDKGWAAVDIYRIENGLIAEHWDVVQDIQPGSINPLSPF
ncbi:nuclear transport factor 2 family protein [Altericroceibacterium endophyticum]|uniref:SnoaL-like domain-containing protein n=1 Tax=Altericroceibacterium endophyticum TaxID=1808508 RepID=A0A6I4TB14_9SPHN|nr:nuclear transport factor 2 family protein [Altericroceibacterium endophyticum]MXO67060.1 hypothetical protein [Altericroceibacterium endophyticum]